MLLVFCVALWVFVYGACVRWVSREVDERLVNVGDFFIWKCDFCFGRVVRRLYWVMSVEK